MSIQPNLLEILYDSKDAVSQKLNAKDATSLDIKKKTYINDKATFRFDFKEEVMAVEKLREGISSSPRMLSIRSRSSKRRLRAPRLMIDRNEGCT